MDGEIVSASVIYQSSFVYELAMLALYRKNYGVRYQAIADLIPQKASVLELCCGPAVLYFRYLREKGIDYKGLDLNPGFVRRLTMRGVKGAVWDLRSEEPLPGADYVVMQASLYHFLPEASTIIDRMLKAAGRQVIIAEPVRNLATAKAPLIRYLARLLSDPGAGPQANRFTEESLDALAGRYGHRLRQSFLSAGGREKICVFESTGEQ